jgi:hypothetical protein
MPHQNLSRLLDAALGSVGSDCEATSELEETEHRIRRLELVIDEGRVDSVRSALDRLAALDDSGLTDICELLYTFRERNRWEALERAEAIVGQAQSSLDKLQPELAEDRVPESIRNRPQEL